MFDIDYLQARPPITKPIIYRYRSGALRTRMRQVLDETARLCERRLVRCEPKELYGELRSPDSPFFRVDPLFMVCDWSLNKREGAKHNLDGILKLLSYRTKIDTALFVPYRHPMTRLQIWPTVEANSLVIEEIAVTAESLEICLRYIESTSDLVRDFKLVDQGLFYLHFVEFIGTGRIDLADLMSEFDRLVLTQVDFKTGTFHEPQDEASDPEQSAFRSLSSPLRRFLSTQHDWDLLDVLQVFDQKHQAGLTGQGLMAAVYRATSAILRSSAAGALRAKSSRRSAKPVIETKMMAIWCAVLLGWERDIVSSGSVDDGGYRQAPGLTLVNLHHLLHDALARMRAHSAPRRLLDDAGVASRLSADPLADLWSAIHTVLDGMTVDRNAPLTEKRRIMLTELTGLLAKVGGKTTSWLKRFRILAEAAINLKDTDAIDQFDEEDGTATPDTSPPVPSKPRTNSLDGPKTFEDIVGQRQVVVRLRELAQTKSATAVILFGPDGVGKRTLARVYAKAIMCSDRLASGSACGACQACQNFETGSIDYTEFDARHANDETLTRELVSDLSYIPLSGPRVFVVSHIDAYKPEVIDIFLKNLEEPTTDTTFIFLTSELANVRMAVQSRCSLHKLNPLSKSDVIRLAKTFAASRGVIGNDEAFELLSEISRGIPGALVDAMDRLKAGWPIDVAFVRKMFDLSWAPDMMKSWQKILTDEKFTVGKTNQVRQNDEAVRRAQLLLIDLLLKGIGEGAEDVSIDPALRDLDEAEVRSLVEAFEAKALSKGLRPALLWRRVAELALVDDSATSDPFRAWISGLEFGPA